MRTIVGAMLVLAVSGAGELRGQHAVERGSWIVGGSARILRQYDEQNKVHEGGFEISPQVGFFLVRGLAATLNARIGWSSREENGTSFSWGFGPGISYYLPLRNSKVLPYVAARTLRVESSFTPKGDLALFLDSDASEEFTWAVAVGGAFFLAHHVALTGEAYYSQFDVATKQTLTDGTVTSQRNSSEQYGLQFGFRIFLH